MNLEDKKDRVAQIKGYPNWKEFYNWVSREREKPEVVAQQIESAMEDVIYIDNKQMTTLQWIIENKSILNINHIERELGMAQGVLSKAVGGRQKLPKKWEKVLDQYFIPKIQLINQPHPLSASPYK